MLKGMVGRFKLKGEMKAETFTKKAEPKLSKAEAEPKPRIALSDSEFGKY